MRVPDWISSRAYVLYSTPRYRELNPHGIEVASTVVRAQSERIRTATRNTFIANT
jgi:hypothetical protein